MLKWIALLVLVVGSLVLVLNVGGIGAGPDTLVGEGGTEGTVDSSSDAVFVGSSGLDGGVAASELGGTRSAIQGDLDQASEGGTRTKVLTISVRDAGGKAPMGEVDVWLLDRGGRPATEWQEAFRSASKRAEYVREHGTVYRTDSLGEVQVPRASSGAVLAQGSGHQGEADWVGPVSGPIVVRMRPVIDLRVRVLDFRGMPAASVPVAVFTRAGNSVRALTKRVTMGNGEAAFPALAAQLEAAGAEAAFHVALDLPVASPEELPIVAGALPDRVLELNLPPAAPMQIHVLNGEGERHSTAMTLSMGRSVPGNAPGSLRFQLAKRHVLKNGQLTLNWVEVGLPMEIQLSGGGELADQVFRVEGPPVADQLHQVDVVWDARHRLLTGRCIGPDGGAIALAAGSLKVIVGGEASKSLGFTADSQGRFRLRVQEPWQRWEPGTSRIASFWIPQSAVGQPVVASHDLAYVVSPGENDLGDILFEGKPFVLSGVVYGVEGNPLPSVVVNMERDASGGGDWEPIPGLGDQTEVDGDFILYGDVAAAPLRLVARRKGYLPTYLEGVTVGSQDISLTVHIDPNADQDGGGKKD